MYMKRLVEFAEREELLESSVKGYEYKKLNWIIKLDLDGKLKGFIPMGKDNKDSVPYKGRSGSNLPPFLLYDKPDFVLGWSSEIDNEKIVERTKKRHTAFCQLVSECAEKTKEPAVQAVNKFLKEEYWVEKIPVDIKDEEWVSFQIEETDEKPIDLPSVQKFWKKMISDEGDGEKDYQCVICGEPCVPLKRHKMDIILPVGGFDRGKLISANDSAYFSYGLKNSLIAPTCSSCEEKYGRALTDLLSSKDYEVNRMTFGKLVYLFWTKEKGVPVFMPIVQPKPEDVQKLRQKLFAGGKMDSFQTLDFYGLALSPNKARVVVRDWEETPLDKMQSNVYRFLQRQRIGLEEKYYGIYALSASLFRDAKKEMKENVPLLLLKHALFRKPLPQSILYQAVNRCRTAKEVKVTPERAGIMRLCLAQNRPDQKEGWLMTLEKDEENVSYLCGRLFAVLEKIQEDAIPKINTTMTDKFFGAASTTPASIFGMLMRNAQSHLSKLRKDNKQGLAVNRSKRLEEIAERIEKFPAVLNLEEQSMFSLGYLHQKNDFFKKTSKEE